MGASSQIAERNAQCKSLPSGKAYRLCPSFPSTIKPIGNHVSPCQHRETRQISAHPALCFIRQLPTQDKPNCAAHKNAEDVKKGAERSPPDFEPLAHARNWSATASPKRIGSRKSPVCSVRCTVSLRKETAPIRILDSSTTACAPTGDWQPRKL